MENSVKHQIQQIIRINSKNGKKEYRGRTYAKNDVVLETCLISDAFELCEPEFYMLVTTVTRDDDSTNIYTVPVENTIYRHELMRLNMRRYIRMH